MRSLLIALVIAVPVAARADRSVQALGQAQVSAGDTARARTSALDDAFRQAVDQVVAGLVEPAARRKAADAVQKRILRRARTYVRKFKVSSEGEEAGVYHVTLTAQIDDASVAAELAALGLSGGGVAPPPASKRPSLVFLGVLRQGDRVIANFGREAASAPALEALAQEIAARGFPVVRAAGVDVPPAVGEGETAAVPLTPEQAAALARKVGAAGAVVAVVEVRDGGPIRGTRQVGAEADVRMRADDVVQPARLFDERFGGAGFGPDASAAGASAARAALGRAGRALGRRLQDHWPAPVATEEGIVVRVRGVTRWPDVEGLTRTLQGAPGVKQVVASRFARREVVLICRGATSPRVVTDAVASVAATGLRASARAVGPREVAVELQW